MMSVTVFEGRPSSWWTVIFFFIIYTALIFFTLCILLSCRIVRPCLIRMLTHEINELTDLNSLMVKQGWNVKHSISCLKNIFLGCTRFPFYEIIFFLNGYKWKFLCINKFILRVLLILNEIIYIFRIKLTDGKLHNQACCKLAYVNERVMEYCYFLFCYICCIISYSWKNIVVSIVLVYCYPWLRNGLRKISW